MDTSISKTDLAQFEGLSIGNFSSIGENVTLGKNVSIGDHCFIGDGVTVGDNTIIQHYAMIEAGASVGSDTFVGTYCKICENASVGSGSRMTSYCEIRANCKVGDHTSFGSRCTLSAGTIVGDHVIVKYGFVATDTPDLHAKEKSLCVMSDYSKYGANVVLMPGVHIGVNAEIGACSQVRHDVGDNEIWYGNPAKFYKKHQ